MRINKFFVLSLAVTGCTATAYAIGRLIRQREKAQLKAEAQLKADLRTWEDEGGNLATSELPAVARASGGSGVSPRFPGP